MQDVQRRTQWFGRFHFGILQGNKVKGVLIRLHTYMPTETKEKKGINGIIKTWQKPLMRFIQSRISSEEEAEDILQEVWYQLSKAITQQDLTNPKAWLYQVARNKIIDSYRRKSADWLEEYLYEEDEEGYLQEALLEADDSPEVSYLQDQFWEELYGALDSLPENQREVFVLHELEGLTLREIAEQSGTNLKTVISRKGYAMRHLREQLHLLFEEFVGD